MLRTSITIATLAMILPGCASVAITSQGDPTRAPTRYARILVAAPTTDLRLQQEIERAVTNAGAKVGVAFVPYHSLFLPGQTPPDEEVRSILREQAIDGLLVLQDETTAPATVVGYATVIPACQSGVSGPCLPGNQGAVVSNTRARQDRFTIGGIVMDAQTGRAVWTSTSQVKRNGATDGNMINSLSSNIVAALLRDAVVQPVPAAE